MDHVKTEKDDWNDGVYGVQTTPDEELLLMHRLWSVIQGSSVCVEEKCRAVKWLANKLQVALCEQHGGRKV